MIGHSLISFLLPLYILLNLASDESWFEYETLDMELIDEASDIIVALSSSKSDSSIESIESVEIEYNRGAPAEHWRDKNRMPHNSSV